MPEMPNKRSRSLVRLVVTRGPGRTSTNLPTTGWSRIEEISRPMLNWPLSVCTQRHNGHEDDELTRLGTGNFDEVLAVDRHRCAMHHADARGREILDADGKGQSLAAFFPLEDIGVDVMRETHRAATLGRNKRLVEGHANFGSLIVREAHFALASSEQHWPCSRPHGKHCCCSIVGGPGV